MKIIITGGHLTPALAMIDFLLLKHPEVEISFIGRTHSRKDQKAVESTEITARKIKFIAFDGPKFAMVAIWQWPIRLGQLLQSTIQAYKLLKSEKPSCVLTFGGYLAVPVVMAASWLKIPVVTHEQTRAVGLANRVIGKMAKFVGVAFAESQKYFDLAKTRVVGSPIRAGLFQENIPTPVWFKNPNDLPILIVTGGSQGSQVINQVVDQLLPELLTDWCVVHQRGPQTANQSVIPTVPGYFAKEWLSETELFWFWKQPKALSISRAGANTVSELAVAKIPAILIPLPSAYKDEQRLNAEWLVSQGGAVILNQENLTSSSLLELIKVTSLQAKQLRQNLVGTSLKTDLAVSQLWQLITLAVQS